MTNREFFVAISNLESVPTELRQFAVEGIAKLDKRNASRNAKPSKVQVENEPIVKAIVELLADSETPILSTEIATALGISTSKATGLLGNLVKEGKVVKTDIKVKGKGVQKGWLLS